MNVYNYCIPVKKSQKLLMNFFMTSQNICANFNSNFFYMYMGAIFGIDNIQNKKNYLITGNQRTQFKLSLSKLFNPLIQFNAI